MSSTARPADSRWASAARNCARTLGSASSERTPTLVPLRRSLGPARGASPRATATRRASTAVVVHQPRWSRLGATGSTPSAAYRRLALYPTTPHSAAGMRAEPPVSLARATSASPIPIAAAEPDELPPGIRVGSSGLGAVPSKWLIPVTPKASSWSRVVPTSRAPCSMSRATIGALAGSGGTSAREAEPARSGRPATAIASLTANRTPASGPDGPCGGSCCQTNGVSATAGGSTGPLGASGPGTGGGPATGGNAPGGGGAPSGDDHDAGGQHQSGSSAVSRSIDTYRARASRPDGLPST